MSIRYYIFSFSVPQMGKTVRQYPIRLIISFSGRPDIATSLQKESSLEDI